MNNLDVSVTNPFFYAYMNECEHEARINIIKKVCGNAIDETELIRELIKEGINPNSLSPQEIELIDSIIQNQNQ